MEFLPEDLVRECLVRVPYKSHEKLKDVCRSWEGMVNSPEFYEDRKRFGTTEQLICLIQHYPEEHEYAVTIYDPAKGTWETLPPFINDPYSLGQLPTSCECVSANGKLVLIGGKVDGGEVLKTVYIYDFKTAKWSCGAEMSVARYRFASSVSPSTGLIYVAGGRDNNGDSVRVAEVYDVEKDKWEILPPSNQERSSGCPGVFLDEKFIVLGVEEFGEIAEESVEVFDPSGGSWTFREDMWSFQVQTLRDSAVAVANSASGRELYVFSEEEVIKYDREKRDWAAVASLPHHIPKYSSATHWRDCIFVTGYNPYEKQYHIPFLFKPSTGEFIEIHCDIGGIVLSATTVEI